MSNNRKTTKKNTPGYTKNGIRFTLDGKELTAVMPDGETVTASTKMSLRGLSRLAAASESLDDNASPMDALHTLESLVPERVHEALETADVDAPEALTFILEWVQVASDRMGKAFTAASESTTAEPSSPTG